MASVILDLSDDLQKKYASFWVRLAAGLVDFLFLGFFFYIFTMVTGIKVWSVNELTFLNNFISGAIFFITLWLYFAGFESSEYQATLGKRAFNTRVVNEQMQRVNFVKTSLRFLYKLASVSILLIGIILVAVQAERQGLHDRWVGTFVIQD